nr:hypothetical protein 1 [bacterium]
MESLTNIPEVWTYEKTAKQLGDVSLTTVRDLARAGELQVVRVGQRRKPDGTLTRGSPRIDPASVADYIERQKVPGYSGSCVKPSITPQFREVVEWPKSIHGKTQSTTGQNSNRPKESRLEEVLKSQRARNSARKR